MEIQEYIEQKKDLYNSLLVFIENSNVINKDFQFLIRLINTQDFLDDQEEFTKFLQLIVKISNNHNRQPDFFKKIGKILLFLAEYIKQTLSNLEIFNIFKSSKPLLLFLISQKIITLDKKIVSRIIEKNTKKREFLCHFFYPEIKPFVGLRTLKKLEYEINKLDPTFFDNFEKKRQIGENDSYICSLIREDSIEKFISYLNQTNLQFSTKIKPSIFETNSFLINKEPTLIEYATFFGSIQIFQYLVLNNVELSSSLWIYAIHSNNGNLIHLLEENHVEPENKTFEKCFEEAIKCHHNDIANYIENNLLDQNIYYSNMNERIAATTFRYYNYFYFPDDLNQNYEFFYLCKYNYYTLVNLFLQIKKNDIKAIIISIINIFLTYQIPNKFFLNQISYSNCLMKFHFC